MSLSQFIPHLVCLSVLVVHNYGMNTERGGIHNSDPRTTVDIFVNYTSKSDSLVHTEKITFQNGNAIKGYSRSSPTAAGVIPSAGAGSTIGGSSSTGLGVPQSAFSNYPRPDITYHARGILILVLNNQEDSTKHDACSPIINNPDDKPWIALIQETTACKKETQFRHAFDAQAKAVIVYGLHDSTSKQCTVMDPPDNDDGTKRIAVFLTSSKIKRVLEVCSKSSMKVIRPNKDYSSETTVSNIDQGFEYNWVDLCNVSISVITVNDDNFLNKTSVLFVSISFILLMIISLAWLVFYYVQRFHYIHTKEQISRRLAHLAKKAVAKIPVKTLKQGDRETTHGGECAICITQFVPSEVVRILPCSHFFHKSCIDPWLLEQRSCPFCKMDILQAYDLNTAAEVGSLVSDHGSDVESVEAIGSSSPDTPRFAGMSHHHTTTASGANSGPMSAARRSAAASLFTGCGRRRRQPEQLPLSVIQEPSSTQAPRVTAVIPSGAGVATSEVTTEEAREVDPLLISGEAGRVAKKEEEDSASSLEEGTEVEKKVCLQVQVERPPAHSDSSASPLILLSE